MSRVPPPPSEPDPLLETWPAGRQIHRVFDHEHPADGFNPGEATDVRGRFHFFEDPSGRRVPVLYGAAGDEAAIAETVFHDVPVRGPHRVVLERRVEPLSLCRLRPARDLTLVALYGFGLRRLGVKARELTDTEASAYPQTVPWAEALHRAAPSADGLVWMSRQYNAQEAVVLFGDRVEDGELQLVGEPRPLITGPGRRVLDAAANLCDVAIV